MVTVVDEGVVLVMVVVVVVTVVVVISSYLSPNIRLFRASKSALECTVCALFL